MGDTRQRILDGARELFNAEGVHRVGLREVARAAGIRLGNLTYHFATKDALVAALVTELHELNQAAVLAAVPEEFSLVNLYRAATTALRNMLTYRFVLLGYVEAVRASPELQAFELEQARRRRRRNDVMLQALVDGEWIEEATLARSDRLWEQGEMIASGWLQTAAVRGMSDERAVRHFAKLGCALLEPHCTKKGARQMRRILGGELDGSG